MAKPIILLICIVLLAAGGYYMLAPSGEGTGPGGMPGMGGPIPLVLETVAQESHRSWNEFSGRLEAVDSVEIRPRVSGAITKIHFVEGAEVTKDMELLTIDTRPFEATLAQSNAALATARSEAALAKTELERAKGLVKQKFLSQSVYDQRRNTYQVTLAAIKAAKAAVEKAQLDLEYARVKAPIAGRVGRAELTVGNIVQAGANAPILTTIVARDRVYAEFDVDEQTYLSLARYQQSSGVAMPVKLKLKSDKTAYYSGEIHSFDNQLDSNSGTIRARAIFDNADGALVPGMYASVRLGDAQERDVIRVSERAVGVDQSRRFVYVVGDDNKVAYREVQLGDLENGKRVVLSGLEAGERIVPSGLQRVRPGAEVKPMDPNAAAPDAEQTTPPASETAS